MKNIFLSLVISTLLLGINFCNGMDAKDAKSGSDSKQKSRSHIVTRGKKKDVDAAIRRKSLAAPLQATKTDEDQAPRTKHRTFSLLQKLSLKPKNKVEESRVDDNVQSVSASKAARSSMPEGQLANKLGVLLVLSGTVAAADESGESKPPAVEFQVAETFKQKRMSVKVLVPTSKSDSQATIFESRDVQVSPAKVDPVPPMNDHKKMLVRKASLLRIAYAKGRSFRDSQTEMSAKELLGRHGVGALCANPSPGQSPRTEDTVTPRTDDTTTPRSNDTVTPRTDDAETPRSGEDASSPDHDEAGDAASNDSANKTE